MKSMITNYGISKTGLIRKNNEDSISIFKNSCYILADGMGGYDGGETDTQAISQLTNYKEYNFNKEDQQDQEDTRCK